MRTIGMLRFLLMVVVILSGGNGQSQIFSLQCWCWSYGDLHLPRLHHAVHPEQTDVGQAGHLQIHSTDERIPLSHGSNSCKFCSTVCFVSINPAFSLFLCFCFCSGAFFLFVFLKLLLELFFKNNFSHLSPSLVHLCICVCVYAQVFVWMCVTDIYSLASLKGF